MTVPDDLFLRTREALGSEYELIRELGRGGMGVVYLAREVALGRDVALKVLPPQYSADPVLAQRFLQEARTAARLDHPHIVSIHQVLERRGLSLFAMKYVSGASLHSMLRSRSVLSFEEVRRILRSCAEALAYAHRAGVVHRDVKPGNILIEESGWVYVTDFGIAKLITEDTPSSRSGAVMGTPHYLAPELCRGGRADAPTDQYSLAVVGYQMLCGQLPFEGDTMEALLAQRLFADPPPLRRFRPDVPADLEVAVERGMRRERAARFPGLLEMAEFLGAGPVTARRSKRRRAPTVEEVPTAPLTLGGRVRRVLRGGLVGATAVAVAAAGSLWAFSRSAPPGGLWPELLEPARELGRFAAGKPDAPPATVERVRERLEWGRLWFKIGRYEDALGEYRQGLVAVTEASTQFETAGPIDSLTVALRQAVEDAKLACAHTVGQSCVGGGD